MSQRKLMRQMAKATMERQGMKHFNKKRSILRHPNGKQEMVNQSVFSRKWKNFVD